MDIKIKLTDPRAKMPVYASPGAAAADLCALLDEPLTLNPGETAYVSTGVAIELPGPEYVALLYNRSGLATKHGIARINPVGVIDSDYRGDMVSPVINRGDEPYTIQPGERITQMCIMPVIRANFIQTDELSETKRGNSGFGSTGRE